MKIDTSEYRKNHGAAPRGLGGWAFSDQRCPLNVPGAVFWAPSNIRYSDAVRAARIHYRGLALRIFVQP